MISCFWLSTNFGVDYDETFASVVKLSTLRPSLAIVAHEDQVSNQMGVKTTFQSDDLNEDIHIEQPKRLVDESDRTMFVSCKTHSMV